MPGHSLGVQSLTAEVEDTLLSLEGALPDWLQGSLVRNGPALFDIGSQSFNHWFDGLAALHKFTFAAGQVTYGCRFLQSNAYKKAVASGRVSSMEFGTRRKMNLLDSVRNVFNTELTDNANVNVTRMNGRWLALTETPWVLEFALDGLTTIGPCHFDDQLKFHVTTAHPHFDFNESALYNVVVSFGKRSGYALIKQGQGENKRRRLATIACANPGYMHSFAMTEGYAILTEYPLRFNAAELLFSDKAYIECYHWRDQQPTNFIVLDKQTGSVVRRFEAEPGFAFHQINAFERGDDVIVDMVYFPDGQIVKALYLNNMRQEGPVPIGQARRFSLNLKSGKMRSEILSDGFAEYPQINYKGTNARDYSFYYCAGNGRGDDFLTDLRKHSIKTNKLEIWKETGCYTGEPVFVPRPAADGAREDDGVLLSVVLNVEKQVSFLVVLDATSMQEMARLSLPQVSPFTFHGIFAGRENVI